MQSGEDKFQLWSEDWFENGRHSRDSEQEEVAGYDVIHLVSKVLVTHVDREQRDGSHDWELGGVF